MDYRAWQSLLSSDEALDPEANERRVDARRDEVLDEVVANIRRGPLGSVKAEAFKLVHAWLLRLLIVRDDERYYIDRSTWSAKRAFGEIARRLRERGILQTERDHYFFSRAELYEVLRRNQVSALDQAKIAGRMRDFDRFRARQAKLPVYLQGGKPAHLSGDAAEGDLTGVGTSHGTVTGRARVLHSVKEIGRVRKGDILVTNHTDPAWTPVFLVISGIVLETGGMLAHGSLLAREYGFPAAQVVGATDLIPDGALITVDGDTGVVHIDEDPARAEDAVPDDSLSETQYLGFSVPEAGIHSYSYLWHRPNLGVITGGTFVFQGVKQWMVQSEICDMHTFMNDSPIRDDLRSYRYDNSYGVEVVEPLTHLHQTYSDAARGNSIDLHHRALCPPIVFGDGNHLE